MDRIIPLSLSLLAGVALGTLFFGGLWLTVRATARSRRPVLLVLVSFWVRLAVVVAVFVLLARGHWQWAVAALLGFILARLVLVRLLGGGAVEQPASEQT